MCFTTAMAGPHFALVTTDTRITRYYRDGTVEHGTRPRLYQLKNGWLTGTGDAEMLAVGAEAVAEQDAADLDGISATLARVEPESMASVRARDPDADLSLHRFVLARTDGDCFYAHRLRANGDVAETAEGQILTSRGLGIPDAEWDGAMDDIRTGAPSVGAVEGMVALMARVQARLADAAPSVSRTIHAGLLAPHGTFLVEAKVADLVASGKAGVVAQQVPPGTLIRPYAVRDIFAPQQTERIEA